MSEDADFQVDLVPVIKLQCYPLCRRPGLILGRNLRFHMPVSVVRNRKRVAGADSRVVVSLE